MKLINSLKDKLKKNGKKKPLKDKSEKTWLKVLHFICYILSLFFVISLIYGCCNPQQTKNTVKPNNLYQGNNVSETYNQKESKPFNKENDSSELSSVNSSLPPYTYYGNLTEYQCYYYPFWRSFDFDDLELLVDSIDEISICFIDYNFYTQSQFTNYITFYRDNPNETHYFDYANVSYTNNNYYISLYLSDGSNILGYDSPLIQIDTYNRCVYCLYYPSRLRNNLYFPTLNRISFMFTDTYTRDLFEYKQNYIPVFSQSYLDLETSQSYELGYGVGHNEGYNEGVGEGIEYGYKQGYNDALDYDNKIITISQLTDFAGLYCGTEITQYIPNLYYYRDLPDIFSQFYHLEGLTFHLNPNIDSHSFDEIWIEYGRLSDFYFGVGDFDSICFINENQNIVSAYSDNYSYIGGTNYVNLLSIDVSNLNKYYFVKSIQYVDSSTYYSLNVYNGLRSKQVNYWTTDSAVNPQLVETSTQVNGYYFVRDGWLNQSYRNLIIDDVDLTLLDTYNPNINNYDIIEFLTRSGLDGTLSSGEVNDIFTLFSLAFTSLGGMLSISILPNITIGVLISIPLVILIVIVVIKMLRGH